MTLGTYIRVTGLSPRLSCLQYSGDQEPVKELSLSAAKHQRPYPGRDSWLLSVSVNERRWSNNSLEPTGTQTPLIIVVNKQRLCCPRANGRCCIVSWHDGPISPLELVQQNLTPLWWWRRLASFSLSVVLAEECEDGEAFGLFSRTRPCSRHKAKRPPLLSNTDTRIPSQASDRSENRLTLLPAAIMCSACHYAAWRVAGLLAPVMRLSVLFMSAADSVMPPHKR